MKQVPCWGPTNIRCCLTKFSYYDNLAPRICALLPRGETLVCQWKWCCCIILPVNLHSLHEPGSKTITSCSTFQWLNCYLQAEEYIQILCAFHLPALHSS